MSSFIEFQAVIMAKLCSIESRLDNIENALGISQDRGTVSDLNDNGMNNKQSLKKEIDDLQCRLAEIKSLF